MNKKTLWTIATLTLAISGSALAKTKVDYVDIRASGINMNDGVIKVRAVNGQFQSTESNTVSYHVEMKAGCKGLYSVGSMSAQMGSVNACEGKVCEGTADAYFINLGAGKKDVPYRQGEMQVPMQYMPVDPVAMCQSLLAKKKEAGVTALQFFNSDHTIITKGTISGIATCEKPGKADQFDVDHMEAPIKIICQKEIMGTANTVQPKKPLTVVSVAGHSIGGGYQPLVITDAFLTTTKLAYSGECPANLNFDINLQGSGKGQVKLHLVEYGQNAYTSVPINFDGTNAWKKHSFTYQLKPEQNAYGKKVERSFRVFLELKDQKANSFEWTAHGEYKKLEWSHTCTPKTTVPGANQKLDMTPDTTPGVKPIRVTPVTPDPNATPNSFKTPVETKPQPVKVIPATSSSSKPERATTPASPKPTTTLKATIEPKPAVGGGLGRDLIRRATDGETDH